MHTFLLLDTSTSLLLLTFVLYLLFFAYLHSTEHRADCTTIAKWKGPDQTSSVYDSWASTQHWVLIYNVYADGDDEEDDYDVDDEDDNYDVDDEDDNNDGWGFWPA